LATLFLNAFMQTNREIYDTAAFGDWSTYTNLETHEAFLARKYLNPAKATVEAGTGGGRIVLGLQKMGFKDLHAYDYVPQFVAEVRTRDLNQGIRLSAQDATRLGYKDESFDQILYLAQILCLVDGKAARIEAVKEAYRILRPGGIGLFSFLSHEVRSGSTTYRLYLTWLGALRFFSRPKRDSQTLPWLKIGGKFNRGALLDRGPYVYWYRAPEAVAELREAGFNVNSVASLKQLQNERVVDSTDELLREQLTGHFYCVCTK
jgi:ubiquinone/menaquinone biosynthesis C-methylase UbiE